ncbi:hypothetical protein Afil01_57730 [Actinorhabdospora filicis]|uniref:Uncharacterized protein n=1 Tax=Actinorhabdospora filicis TaxID=1785913 RepID=A0A9W6SUG5_9ACTN|nr:hypothetical protein [Actinorhabdospora filicis]GLZ80966.1 hypothetical protein Afil01_57730 [Actinorhabdospora filicis]
MGSRTSPSLVQHIKLLLSRTDIPAVRVHVEAALAHVSSPKSRPTALVRYLRDGVREADRYGRWDVSARLHHLAEFAAGRLTEEQLDERLAKADDDTAELRGQIGEQIAETVRRLTAAIDNPDSTAEDLRSCFKHREWLLGGAFLPARGRAAHEVAVLRADGVHVWAFGRANVPALVERFEDRVVPGGDVHRLAARTGTPATVVLGHPRYATGFEATEVREAVASYWRPGLTVMTYASLTGSLERMTT